MLQAGTAIHRYVIEAPLGAGGMGAVYRARDTHLDRAVALKVLSGGASGIPDDEARARLVREARAVAALSHPNAVSIYDAGDSEHGPFIVMELVDGETLRSAASGASVPAVVGWMKAAALALGEAHERGIVHRDVKPENLIVRRDGMLKVLDFGIARQGQNADASAPTQGSLPTLTGTGMQIGTPRYMAPEQIKGKKLDGRTDQFSWGVTTYEALAGRSPWQSDGGALGLVASILEEDPEPLSALRPDVPARVSEAVARAMSKKPDQRFASMHELVAALDGETSEPVPAPLAPSRSAQPPAEAPRFETQFSEGTVKAVIGKALSLEQQGGYSKSELRQAALELGIGEAALEEATRLIRSERQRTELVRVDDSVRARILWRRRRSFYVHLIAYIGGNLVFMMPAFIKGFSDKSIPLLVPGILWGIGLAIHAMKAFSDVIEPKELRKEREREARELGHAAPRHRLEQPVQRPEAEERFRVEAGGATAFTTALRAEAEAAAEAEAQRAQAERRGRH